MNNNKLEKQKVFSTVVTVILILFFIGGFWLGLDRVRSMEGTFPPNEIKESKTEAPENEIEAVEYFEYVIENTKKNTASVTKEINFGIDSSSFTSDASDSFNRSALFALDNLRNQLNSSANSEININFINFGEDISLILDVADIKNYSVTDFFCNYIYYQCPSCSEKSDIQHKSCDLCGSQREYFLKYHDEYDIGFTVTNIAPGADGANPIDCAGFTKRNDEEIANLTADIFSEDMIMEKIDVSYNSYKINFKVRRLTDEITYLSFSKNMSVSADVSFSGKYSDIGKVNASFDMWEKLTFNFTWASLSLNEEKLVIEPKGNDNLLATLTCENPTDMTVTWSSSDESIATVDSEGYIKTGKNTGEAVITATFEYLGKTYSDSCTVFVRVPVESMKMNIKKLTLKTGESAQLEATVSPKKATVRTVKWYSENEDIAVVDVNGTVTAKANGTVVIYALSDDGYYRSTCEVTVE